jgi:hypothetical protein
MYLHNAAVEYEGTGFREHPQGWELKVKPQSPAIAVRWRKDVARDLAVQTFYLHNKPYYSWEDGNAGSVDRQSGETRFSVHTLMVDLRRPFAGSSFGMMAGLMGARQTFERKNIINGGVPAPESLIDPVKESLTAAGAYVGVHGGTPRDARGWSYWSGEASIGHFLHTRNTQRSEGATHRRWGECYTLRWEGGVRSGNWRWGLGYLRQELGVKVPGGRALPNGAAVSFPVNKTNFQGAYLAVTYVH